MGEHFQVYSMALCRAIYDYLPNRMPSTHAASITYYATYITTACVSLPLHHSFDFKLLPQGLFRSLVPAVILPWASLIVASRVWLEHHTWKQVAAGFCYGGAFAGLWFALWTKGGLSMAGAKMEDWFVSNFSSHFSL
jgi:dolichyldiphosphatase